MMHSDWPGMARYMRLLAAARARGEVPSRLSLYTGKPISEATFQELIEAGKLTPRQIRDIGNRIAMRRSQGRREPDRTRPRKPTHTPIAVPVAAQSESDRVLALWKAEQRKRLAGAYRQHDRTEHIKSAGNGL